MPATECGPLAALWTQRERPRPQEQAVIEIDCDASETHGDTYAEAQQEKRTQQQVPLKAPAIGKVCFIQICSETGLSCCDQGGPSTCEISPLFIQRRSTMSRKHR